jgi:signal transduction histidine kinase
MQPALAENTHADAFASRPAWRRYGVAVVASMVAILLRAVVDPWLGDRSPFMTLALGYVVAAWYGGTGPGWVATVLTTAGGLVLFVDPRGLLVLADTAEQLRVGSTLGLGMLASWVIGSRTQALEGERWTAARLREREAEVRRTSEQLLDRTRDLESFTHAVSHELRTPLRHLRAFADALVEDCATSVDPVALEHAACIATAGERMERLIADLLAFSRVSHGAIPTEPTAVDDVVALALDELAPEITRRGARIETHLACDVVLGHGPTLARALTNLLDNAIKYVPDERTPTLRIESEVVEDRGRITVIDNGIGVDAADLPRAFGMFVRLHASDEVPGAGIGLALVARAAERMGGTTGARSEVGSGSAFWIELARPTGMPHEEDDVGRAHHPAGRGQPLRRPAAAAVGA